LSARGSFSESTLDGVPQALGLCEGGNVGDAIFQQLFVQLFTFTGHDGNKGCIGVTQDAGWHMCLPIVECQNYQVPAMLCQFARKTVIVFYPVLVSGDISIAQVLSDILRLGGVADQSQGFNVVSDLFHIKSVDASGRLSLFADPQILIVYIQSLVACIRRHQIVRVLRKNLTTAQRVILC